MKATKENIGQTFKIRLNSYKSIRHYGGREITPYKHIVNATLIGLQRGPQYYIMSLQSDMKDYKGRVQFKKGHKIAVTDRDFDV